MKGIWIAGALALAAGTQAFAADLPPPSPPRAPAMYVAPPSPAYNWSGFYLGVNGGYGIGSSNWNPGGTVSSGSFDTSGFVVGGTLGANAQVGAFVFGVETDLDYSDISGNVPTTFCAACQTTNNWLGTTRGRAGVAMDRILFYGTGGVAYGDIRMNANGVSNVDDKIGWTAGAGIEGALAENWTAKLEYLYVDLGSATCTSACGGLNLPVTLRENLIRLGVNYKFTY